MTNSSPTPLPPPCSDAQAGNSPLPPSSMPPPTPFRSLRRRLENGCPQQASMGFLFPFVVQRHGRHDRLAVMDLQALARFLGVGRTQALQRLAGVDGDLDIRPVADVLVG